MPGHDGGGAHDTESWGILLWLDLRVFGAASL